MEKCIRGQRKKSTKENYCRPYGNSENRKHVLHGSLIQIRKLVPVWQQGCKQPPQGAKRNLGQTKGENTPLSPLHTLPPPDLLPPPPSMRKYTSSQPMPIQDSFSVQQPCRVVAKSFGQTRRGWTSSSTWERLLRPVSPSWWTKRRLRSPSMLRC